jgi:site-specific DNA-methyltransferase (adenine-specific)/modification methylase
MSAVIQQIGMATVYCGDAYEIVQTLEPRGLLLTDPMYGMGANAKGLSSNRGMSKMIGGTLVDNQDWNIDDDTKAFDPAPFLRFKKIVMWGGNHFAHLLPQSPKWFVWDKRDGAASDDNSDAELAWSNLDGKAIRTYRQLWKGVCRAGRENLSRNGAKLHPYQKPVGLGKFCIAQAKLKPGELVVDFFAGSGAFGVAALEMGHPVILVEKEPHFFDVICEQVERAQQQASFEVAV